MKNWLAKNRVVKGASLAVMVLAIAGPSLPAFAQDSLAETRLRRMEAEIKALQRQVFPGADGKYFTPEITSGGTSTPPPAGTPASTPVTDLLARMETIERQLAQLTSQTEQNSNRISQIESRLASGGVVPAGPPVVSGTPSAITPPASQAITPTPAPTRPTQPAATNPSATRVAAVQAIEKPRTGDAGDDEYSYGFRLWEAKFYPEAQQQLKMMVERYPRHARISYARNLLGRAYLDDGKPREAATWFLQNYQADKTGARSPDSLLYLAESMKQLNDTNRMCVALSEFSQTYSLEASGRLKSQYDQTRSGAKCNR